ncbi:MAG: hypothetical protein ACRC1G_10600 [Bradyrhizobium sp.]
MDQATITLEATKLAVGLAKDLNVQLLTLSSALIGLTVVLIKDVKKTHNRRELALVGLVLVIFIFSIGCGILAIMKLIGSLAPVDKLPVLSVDEARWVTGAQIIAFLTATFLFSLYGFIALVTFGRKDDRAAPATPSSTTDAPQIPPKELLVEPADRKCSLDRRA